MRVAVMSDIHGFDLALETIIGEIVRTGPFDVVVVAGDLCEVGPNPAGVLRRLAEHPDWVLLKGNTDDDLVTGSRSGHPGFAAQQIGPAGVSLLESLPLSHRVQPPGEDDPSAALLVVHANPHDLRARLDPNASDRELREVLGDAVFGTIAFGHVHISYQRNLDYRQLVDVSAVGNPKDGELTCRYGTFSWDSYSRRWDAEIHRVPYPVEETLAEISASDLPNPEKVARVLQRASY